jgi:multiple sugar transport system substrate-binding protein
MMKQFRTKLGICCLLVVLLVTFSVGSAFANVTLKYANWQWLESGRSDVLQEFVDAFEAENPDIKIEKVAIPYSSYNDALLTQFEAGSGPDVMFVQDMALIPWIDRGYLAELDGLIDMEKFKDYFLVQQSTAVKDNKNFAVIYEGFPYAGLSYNKILFEEAGIGVPKTPEELLEASDAIYEATGKPGLIHPTNLSNPSYIMQGGMIVVMGFGGRIVKDGKFAVTEPEFIKGVEFLKKIYNLESTPAGTEFGVQRQQFLAGDAGMVMDGSYWPSIVKLNNPDLYEHLGVANLPFPDPASPFETNWYAVNANSENKEAAAKFVEFLLQPDQANKWAVISSIPGLTYTYDAVQQEYPWFKVYSDVSPYGVVRMLPGYESHTPEIRRMVADAISSAMSGQESSEKAMKRLEKDLINRFGDK